jgi:hypothetical protein
VVKFNQEDEQNDVTILIKSPEPHNGSLGEKVNILVNAWSTNKREIEFTEQIDLAIRKPDIVMKGIKLQNTDLADGTNVTIRATMENKHRHVEDLVVSLYINDVWIENKTITDFLEDTRESVEFYWQVAKYNLTEERGRTFRFRIVANVEETIEELDFDNNRAFMEKLIGEKPEPEPFNWRPVIFSLSILIALVVLWVVYRWRRKI